MNRVAAFAAALAAALIAGSQAPAKVEGRLFALLGNQSGQFVVEVNPGTLEPLAGRRLKVVAPGSDAPWTWALDPSRHTLAIARGNRLRFVDLPTLRAAGSVKLLARDEPEGLLQPSGVVWLRPDRIVVLRRGVERYEIAVLDVARRTIVSRRMLGGGYVVDSARTPSEVVILRAPHDAIGPASLLVIGSGGEVREVPLGRVLAGWHFDHDASPPSGRENLPALALDAQRRVAYVVTPDGLVAEVGLDGEQVRYHAVHGRFAKLYSGWSREALMLGGKILVTGSNSDVWTLPDGKPAMRMDPAGLDVIDPATWETRRLASTVSSVVPWAGGFLATGETWSHEPRIETGMGLAIYGPDGVERGRLLDGKRLWISLVYDNRAYVTANEEPMRIVDLEQGRVVGTRKGSLPWLLLEQNAPVW
jgi:hypothetical protein